MFTVFFPKKDFRVYPGNKMNRVIIFGAGPAGLTAGYAGIKRGLAPEIFEQDLKVGGISKTVDYNGYLFDIGGHRFFTKYDEVKLIWEELLGSEFLIRPRLSRIYFNNHYFDYPLKPANALKNLGLLESTRVILSYLAGHFRPTKSIHTFEDWVSNKFGKRLFGIFFKTYTEKVWGISCKELQADWAAQRIKSLSLTKALLNSFGFMKDGRITTLIDSFYYPNMGPGQMWSKAKEFIESNGGRVELGARVTCLKRREGKVLSAMIQSSRGQSEARGDYYLSSLPLKDLILSIEPKPPDMVVKAALGLRYRDFITVGLIINKKDIFPDTWIYIHSPNVQVGRIQNFKNWSSRMVPEGDCTSLGLEYFCFETDAIWKKSENDLLNLAISEIGKLRLAEPNQVIDGTVIRSKKAYPIYDAGYRENVEIIRNYLSTFSNLQTIGRNGLHRYNNQDHSMLTALYAIGNILGENHSIWDINMEDAYHESS
jgi:protoporphyrinogen oxidase